MWETFGCVGPATADFLREAVAGPALASVQTGLLRDVSVGIWWSVATVVQDGYDNGYGLEGAPDGGEAGAGEGNVEIARLGE